jgi:hypothetical protein
MIYWGTDGMAPDPEFNLQSAKINKQINNGPLYPFPTIHCWEILLHQALLACHQLHFLSLEHFIC